MRVSKNWVKFNKMFTLSPWVYNHERPNMALGGYTPKQRLAQAA